MADQASEKLDFELVTPARLLFSEPVDMVVVPGSEGDFGVLAGHTPVLTTVRPGTIDVHDGGEVTKRLFVEGGFAEATSQRCTVLAEAAIEVDDIDLEAANARLEAAREAETEAEDTTEDDGARAAAERETAIASALVAAADQGGGR